MKRLLCVAAAATLCGCIGPVDYLTTTALKARRAVAEARTANAEKLAPYEYWSAVIYLKMSREKAGHADFEDSWKYGRKSAEMGTLAKKLASEKAETGPTAIQPAPDETPVVVEPKSGGADTETPTPESQP